MVVQWPFLEVLSSLKAMFWCFCCDGGTQPTHGQFMTPELPPFLLLTVGEIMNLAFGTVLAVWLISLHLFLKSLTPCTTLLSFFGDTLTLCHQLISLALSYLCQGADENTKWNQPQG